jgi:hypothetical protein
MLPTKSQVIAQIEQLIANLKDYAKDEYDLNVDNLDLKIKFKSCDFLGTAGFHIDKPVMKLNILSFISKEVIGYKEYPRISRNSHIGSFESNDWRLVLDNLVVHEFAHVIQYGFVYSPQKSKLIECDGISKKDYYIKNHGWFNTSHSDFFQSIYTDLRMKFINHRVNGRIGVDIPAIFKHEIKPQEPNTPKHKPENKGFEGAKIQVKDSIFTFSHFTERKMKYNMVFVSQAGKTVRANALYVNMHRIN